MRRFPWGRNRHRHFSGRTPDFVWAGDCPATSTRSLRGRCVSSFLQARGTALAEQDVTVYRQETVAKEAVVCDVLAVKKSGCTRKNLGYSHHPTSPHSERDKQSSSQTKTSQLTVSVRPPVYPEQILSR